MKKNRAEKTGEVIGYVLVIAKHVIISGLLPVTQIWFMLFARWMDWWPEPGITWFDWIMAAILPAYAVWQAMFG